MERNLALDVRDRASQTGYGSDQDGSCDKTMDSHVSLGRVFTPTKGIETRPRYNSVTAALQMELARIF
jgi:hypothetical protein